MFLKSFIAIVLLVIFELIIMHLEDRIDKLTARLDSVQETAQQKPWQPELQRFEDLLKEPRTTYAETCDTRYTNLTKQILLQAGEIAELRETVQAIGDDPYPQRD